MRSAQVTLAALLFLVTASGCSFDVPEGETADVDLSWQLTRRGAPAACESIGAEQVRIDFDSGAPGPRFADWFPCDALSGTARFLPAGDYMISLTLVGQQGHALEQSTLYPVAVEAPWSVSPRIDVEVSTGAPVQR